MVPGLTEEVRLYQGDGPDGRAIICRVHTEDRNVSVKQDYLH